MGDDYSRFELVQAAHQAWNAGYDAAIGLQAQISRRGALAVYEDRDQWKENHPDGTWTYDNPHTQEYAQLQAKQDE